MAYVGLLRLGVPVEVIDVLTQNALYRVFIELGTFKGATALWAASRFDKVFTIEASEQYYSAFRQQVIPENITPLFGDSRDVLPGLCEQFDQPAIVWLDSHWSGGNTAGLRDQCPLLKELEILLNGSQEHILLIDDARFYLCAPAIPLDAAQWPRIGEIISMIRQRRPNYSISVIDDVIVAIPSHLSSALDNYCQMRCMVMDWRLGNYLRFLERPNLWNLLQLVRVLGGVFLKRIGILSEVPQRVIKQAATRFQIE